MSEHIRYELDESIATITIGYVSQVVPSEGLMAAARMEAER